MKINKLLIVLSLLLTIFSTGVMAKKHPQASGDACSLANQADSYVFAISWQPAFCATHQSKPECTITDTTSYQAGNFTLHGLWPNKNSCGINYACTPANLAGKDFCTLPDVGLSQAVVKDLSVVMPSVASGSCLDRHEWFKHGTCQDKTNDQYFETGVSLVKQFNDSGIAAFVQQNIGKTVNSADFLKVIDDKLGEGASKRVSISCTGGNLTDLTINLPAEVPVNPVLKDLIVNGAEGGANKCGNSFKIVPIGG